MKLIETKTAPNPRRVRIFLHEKGVVIPTQQVELSQLRTPEFSAMNGEQRVPILVLDDGTVIAETVAICRYIEELQPEPPLMGRGPAGRAMSEMWQRRIELGVFAQVAHAFRHLHPSMVALEAPQVADWGQANKTKAQDGLVRLDQHLAGHRFLCGDAYSIADITLLVAMDFMRPARIARPDGLAHLARWYDEVSTRPSAGA